MPASPKDRARSSVTGALAPVSKTRFMIRFSRANGMLSATSFNHGLESILFGHFWAMGWHDLDLWKSSLKSMQSNQVGAHFCNRIDNTIGHGIRHFAASKRGQGPCRIRANRTFDLRHLNQHPDLSKACPERSINGCYRHEEIVGLGKGTKSSIMKRRRSDTTSPQNHPEGALG